MKYDTRQIGIKPPDGLLVEKCKMTLDELTSRRLALGNKYREDMNDLATEYAVRNSKFRVGDIVKVGDARQSCMLSKITITENVTRLRKIRLSANFHNVRNMTFS